MRICDWNRYFNWTRIIGQRGSCFQTLTQQYKYNAEEIKTIANQLNIITPCIPCVIKHIESTKGYNTLITTVDRLGLFHQATLRLKKGHVPVMLTTTPYQILKYHGQYDLFLYQVNIQGLQSDNQLNSLLYKPLYELPYSLSKPSPTRSVYLVAVKTQRDGWDLLSSLKYLFHSGYPYLLTSNPYCNLLSLGPWRFALPEHYAKLQLPHSRQLVYLQDLHIKPHTIGLIKKCHCLDYVSAIDFAIFASQSILHHRFVTLWVSLSPGLTKTQLYELIKCQTVRLKIISNYFSFTNQFIEAEVLINRDETVDLIDWEAELKLRTQPVSNAPTYEQVYDETRTLLQQKNTEYHYRTLDEFIALCALESPAGAFYVENLPYFKQEVRKKFRKCYVPTQKLGSKIFCLPFLKPQQLKKRILNIKNMYAQTHIKFEPGKQRALYATDTFSHLACEFVLPRSELFLPDECIVGAPAEENEVHKKFIPYNIPFVYAFGTDYAGFNEQHKLSSMIAVLQAVYDHYYPYMSDDQRTVFQAVISARQHMKVKFRQIKKTAYVKDTLMSGERWTTFLNSMLNVVYYRLISKGLSLQSYHNGDDAIAFTNDISTYETLLQRAKQANIVIKKHKCYYGASSEFLRKQMYFGQSRSYLARAISSFTYMKIESLEPHDKMERLKAYVERLQNYIDCGGKLSVINVSNLFKYISCSVGDYNALQVDSQHGGTIDILTDAGRVLAKHLRARLGLHMLSDDVFIVKDKHLSRNMETIMLKAPLIRKALHYLFSSPNMTEKNKKLIKSLVLMRFIQDQKTISYHIEKRGRAISAELLRTLKKAVLGVEIPFTRWDKTAQLLKMSLSRQTKASFISRLLQNSQWLMRLDNMRVVRRV